MVVDSHSRKFLVHHDRKQKGARRSDGRPVGLIVVAGRIEVAVVGNQIRRDERVIELFAFVARKLDRFLEKRSYRGRAHSDKRRVRVVFFKANRFLRGGFKAQNIPQIGCCSVAHHLTPERDGPPDFWRPVHALHLDNALSKRASNSGRSCPKSANAHRVRLIVGSSATAM